MGNRVIECLKFVDCTLGPKVTVHKLTLGDTGELSSELTHVLTGHSRDVLSVDTQADLVVSGGLDTTVLVYKLGPENLFKVVHKLEGHTLKVEVEVEVMT